MVIKRKKLIIHPQENFRWIGRSTDLMQSDFAEFFYHTFKVFSVISEPAQYELGIR